jgi:glycerophosphoryl diester phosphodiesterase
MHQATPILYAHRGATAEEPENTLPAFRKALEVGADAIETDAHMTLDGHVVLSHDTTGERMAGIPLEIRRTALVDLTRWDVGWGFVSTGSGRSERPFAGRGYRMPTLDEVLEALPDVVFNVDAKQRRPSMVEPLLQTIARHRAEDRVRVASFHAATLREVRARGYRGETGLAQLEVARLIFTPTPLLRLAPLGGQRAQVPTRVGRIPLARLRFIEKCHALGIRVDFWTIDDPAEAQRLLELGADGVMTDDPRPVAEVFARFRRAVTSV